MSKKKSRSPTKPSPSATAEQAILPHPAGLKTSAASPGGHGRESLPKLQQRLISCAIAAHFTALLIALSANLAPSYLQGQLTAWLAGYLVTTNQDYGAVPLELTHAEPIDFPLLVDVRTRDGKWHRLPIPGATQASKRSVQRLSTQPIRLSTTRWPNMSRLIRLILIDQPEHELPIDLAAHFVNVSEFRDEAIAVRLLAPKVLSYDEYAAVAVEPNSDAEGPDTLFDGLLDDKVVLYARIVRDQAGNPKLIPRQENLRTVRPLHSAASPSGVSP